jgi:geminin
LIFSLVSETPPEEYWCVLAERRRLALAETLEENEQLHDQVEKLKAQVSDLENQVKDTNYFAMMYKLASSSEPEIH